MVNLKVKYFADEVELNEFLDKFDLQNRENLPALQKVTYLVDNGKIYAIVEYVDGELVFPKPEELEGKLPPEEPAE